MKNLKRIIFLSIFIGFVPLIATNGAYAYQFTDSTNAWWYQGNQGAKNFTWDFVDNDLTYGYNFNTFGANLSGNTLTIFTNWSPAKDGMDTTIPKGGSFSGIKTADLFITNMNNNLTYAIRLDNGLGTVFVNPTPVYSTNIINGLNLFYGGTYQNGASWSPIPVWVNGTGNNNLPTVPVTWTYNYYDQDKPFDPINGKYDNMVQVDLSGLNLGNDWFFFWGTGTCGNDPFTGEVKVPEPSIIFLLGAGLIGLSGLRRRFK
jgi:hypothetical protein